MHKALVILTPGFPENERDSTCMPDRQIFVKALKKAYPELNIIVLAFQYPFYSAEYIWNGVTVISIGGKSKGGLHHKITWMRVWYALRMLNKKYSIIGLLSFWIGECALIGYYFAKLNRLKHYSWVLGQDAKKGNKYLKWMNIQNSSLIALSDYLANNLKENYGLWPGNIIPAGIDTDLFDHQIVERDIDVLGVGSLIPLKQYEIFVEVIRSLKNHFPEIKAVICGKGPEMERLEKMIRSYGLENNLLLKGELSHTEVLQYMQRSKVFLHPSNYEGFSTVLLEALYGGAHVVSFFRPMEAEFLHHRIVNDIDEMGDKVFELLSDPDRDSQPVFIYGAEKTAKNIMNLFECQAG